jgi:DNA-binding MarR family transcriptional regulator
LGRRFHTILNRALVDVTKPEGLTLVEPAVLASLHDAPNIDERRLAERIGIDLASAQRMVRHLELLGFVCRVQGKHRHELRLLSLTPAGLDLYARLYPAIVAVRDRVMAALSEREREALQDLLARVINANELKSHRRSGGSWRGQAAATGALRSERYD